MIFLVNHRFEFYWYIPSLGVCGLIALAIQFLAARLGQRLPARAAAAAGSLAFLMLSWGNYTLHKQLTADSRAWQREVSEEYRRFITGLRRLPAPEAGAVVFFRSMPRYFDAVVLLSAVQVAFRRTDIDIRVVSRFPPDTRYRISVQNGYVLPELWNPTR